MEDFNTALGILLQVIKGFNGSTPIISINYKDEELLIKDAPSGFLKALFKNELVLARLSTKGISVSYFLPPKK